MTLETLRSLAALLPGAVVEERRDGIACLRRPDTATLTGRVDVLARVCLEDLERRVEAARQALVTASAEGEVGECERAQGELDNALRAMSEGRALAKDGGL